MVSDTSGGRMVSDTSGGRMVSDTSGGRMVGDTSGGRMVGDTSASNVTTPTTPSRRDRAQLLLITAVIIAAFLLSAVVLLNVLHESPQTSSAQDGKSLGDAEGITEYLASDLHRYFLAHSADTNPHPGSDNTSDNPANNRVPFADEGQFEENVSTFATSYMALSTRERASIVDVELDTSASDDTGAIVWKTNETLVPANETQLQDAEALPRVQFTIENVAPGGGEIEVEADRENLFTLDLNFGADSAVTADGETVCDELEDPFEVDLVHGVGEVRAENEYCRIDVSEAIETAGDEFNVTVGTNLDAESGVDDSVEWTYAISGTNADVTDGSLDDPLLDDDYTYDTEYWDRESDEPPLWYREDVLVDPVFSVTYVDPSISYDGTLRLFEGDS